MGSPISEIVTRDIRFPTSRGLHGSDAMNPDPDYSLAYVVVRTGEGREGCGFTFTIGRGTDLVVAAVDALGLRLMGRDADGLLADMGATWRLITGDSQLRWLGPEKGVVHLATGALVNALWDLKARMAGKPLWKLLADMSPEELVACVPFQYLTDAITPEWATDLLAGRCDGREQRERQVRERGFPAYTTSTGWLGYPDDEVRRLAEAAVRDGWRTLKMKVGGEPADDERRAQIVHDALGGDGRLLMDANQVWDVGEAISRMEPLARFDPYWIEEPTSPDDVVGHAAIARAVAPILVATGEQAQNRVIFKQLMQADAIGVCQLDACRLGGVNEVLAVLLLAARFEVPVCPHAGGVGLCELVQHLSIFDYVAVGADLEGRMVEYVDHLHEHFVDPVSMREGHYLAPTAPGYSAEMHPESLAAHEYPGGAVWREAVAS
jgi:L-fuconate dehydratase